MKAGKAIVKTIIAHGINTVFIVPGNELLLVIEELRAARDEIRTVSMRSVTGAAYAAMAYGRLSGGRPAGLLVSGSPGVSGVASGLLAARQDSIPVAVLVGDGNSLLRRGKVDYPNILRPIVKEVIVPDTPDSVISTMARAISLARSGRPGPVVVILPVAIAGAEISITKAQRAEPESARPPSGQAVEQSADLIANADNPVIVAGEMVAMERSNFAVEALAEEAAIPIVGSYRYPDIVDNTNTAYVGHTDLEWPNYLRTLLTESDLILAVGTRLDSVTTGYGAFPHSAQPMIHIFPDESVLSVYPSRPAINAHTRPTLEALLPNITAREIPKIEARRQNVSLMHSRYMAFSGHSAMNTGGLLNVAYFMAALSEQIPDGSVIVVDSGSFALWAHRFLRTTISNCYCGMSNDIMGYAISGAIAAVMLEPGYPAFALVGDSGFATSACELMTIAEHNLPVKIVLLDNGAHGSVLLEQRRQDKEAAGFSTTLGGPDYMALAQSYQIRAVSISADTDIDDAIQAFVKGHTPALLHVALDIGDLSPYLHDDL